MLNQSGLRPLGRAVLVRMVELDEFQAKTILIPEQVRKNSATMEQRAEVVEVGEEAWTDEKVQRAAAGDRVYITKFAGFVAVGPKDGKLYRLVNDRDIFCRIEE